MYSLLINDRTNRKIMCERNVYCVYSRLHHSFHPISCDKEINNGINEPNTIRAVI